MAHAGEIILFALHPFPEIHVGDDIAAIILNLANTTPLQQGDILVVTQKIVSKAEGQRIDLRTITPSPFATEWAMQWNKDPRQIEVVLQESRRIVKMDRGILICETHHGFICANAGVDASNVGGDDIVCLLPDDPDQSALALHHTISAATGFSVPVIITDSFGRTWRNGITNVAIGVAGMLPLADYRGQNDTYGRQMHVSILAIADEIASAAELITGKLDQRPVVVVRGYTWESGNGCGADLIMDPTRDLFR